MAEILQFSAVKSAEDLRTALRNLAADKDFDWLEAIVGETMDEFAKHKISQEFYTRMERDSPFSRNLVEENVEECGRLLNNTLDIRAELMTIEAQAIQSAVDLQLSIQTSELDKELSGININASSSQAGLDPVNGMDALVRRATLIDEARQVQAKYHNTKGSALNYAERCRFLRGLYVNNIELAYYRISSISLGSLVCFGVTLPDIPAWSGDSDSLLSLVKWLRSANVLLQSDRGERQIDVVINLFEASLSNYKIFPPGIISREAIQGSEEIIASLDVDYMTLNGIDGSSSPRIIQMGAALVFPSLAPHINSAAAMPTEERSRRIYWLDQIENVRRSVHAGLTIKFPYQRSPGTVGLDNMFELAETVLNVGVWSEGPPSDSIRLIQNRSFFNANPFGQWTLKISDILRLPDRSFVRNALNEIVNAPADLANLLVPIDVAIILRMAVSGRSGA